MWHYGFRDHRKSNINSKKVSLTIAEIILPKTPVKESQSEHVDRAVDRVCQDVL